MLDRTDGVSPEVPEDIVSAYSLLAVGKTPPTSGAKIFVTG